MYGALVCPRCRKAKGVNLAQKTTTCACGFQIRVTRTRVRARAETTRELAPLVAQLNAELAGGLEEYRKAVAIPKRRRSRDVHARVVAAASKGRDRAHRVRSAAIELTKELEVFSREDWRRVLDGLGIPDPEGALDELVRNSAVYEPRAGFYRAVSLTP